MNFRDDWNYSNKFVPQIKRIVGPRLLDVASLELDTRQATDLIVLMARDMRIAARVRRPGYAEQFGNEFTVRCHRDSGAETELSKIINGWGDWMFYGHANDDHQTLALWLLIDLSAFRAALIRNKYGIASGRKSNGDGTEFAWFDVSSFPEYPPILIASGGKRRNEQQLELLHEKMA